MFEPEIRDATTLKRWAIVRTHHNQSLAEHSFYVTLYAMELARWTHPDDHKFHAAVAQYSLWHDLRDEIFTGDIPGPAKRRMITDKLAYKAQTEAWTRLVFGNDPFRFGEWHDWHEELKCIVKIADELDQVFEMACEIRMGNLNVRMVMKDALDRACKWVDELFDEDPRGEALKIELIHAAERHVMDDLRGPSVFTLGSA